MGRGIGWAGSSGKRTKEGVRWAAGEASPWIERVARFGYAAYGIVYALVGVLAFQASLGGGGETTGQEGALQTILLAPLGRFLLGLVCFGLFMFVVARYRRIETG